MPLVNPKSTENQILTLFLKHLADPITCSTGGLTYSGNVLGEPFTLESQPGLSCLLRYDGLVFVGDSKLLGTIHLAVIDRCQSSVLARMNDAAVRPVDPVLGGVSSGRRDGRITRRQSGQ